MLSQLITPYRGLSKEVWFLALTTLINRAGAMVIPFLSLYLNKYLDYSLGQIGWIMTFYGFGSVVGVFIGGKLTDKIGYHKVMYTSLILTGFAFIGFPFSNSYALDRAKKGNPGEYMALYSMSFSFAHILGPNIGMHISDKYGFSITFYLMGFLLLIACLLLFWLKRRIQLDG